MIFLYSLPWLFYGYIIISGSIYYRIFTSNFDSQRYVTLTTFLGCIPLFSSFFILMLVSRIFLCVDIETFTDIMIANPSNSHINYYSVFFVLGLGLSFIIRNTIDIVKSLNYVSDLISDSLIYQYIFKDMLYVYYTSLLIVSYLLKRESTKLEDLKSILASIRKRELMVSKLISLNLMIHVNQDSPIKNIIYTTCQHSLIYGKNIGLLINCNDGSVYVGVIKSIPIPMINNKPEGIKILLLYSGYKDKETKKTILNTNLIKSKEPYHLYLKEENILSIEEVGLS